VRAAYRLAHLTFAGTVRYERFARTHLFDFAAHVVTHADTLSPLVPGRVRVLPTPAYPLAEPAWTADEVDGRFGLAGKRVALLLGFPQPSKGFDRAVDALPHLPADVVLVQVGQSERSQAEAARLTARAGGRFVRTGPLTDAELAAVLRRADVGLAPFRSVHQSSSLGHLIAAGLPIVASRIPATERLAADGAGIRFADCDDPRALAEAVVQALECPAVREGLWARNTEYAAAHGFGSVARFVAGLVGASVSEPVAVGGVR
jgi:glycosyltransferase involved in cell wall biosynthesis